MAQPPAIVADAPWLIEAEASLPQGSLRRIALLSLLTILVGFGGFTAWAAFARIDSAVPAAGVVVASGKRKTVSLVDSGILKELLVQEGDKVAAGQVLLRLDDVQPRAARSQASVLFWSAVARAARLAAEAADRRELPVSLALRSAAADPAVAAAVEAETYQFHSRWGALDASTRVQERKIAQQEAQLNALRAQIASTAIRMSLVQEELRGVDFLMQRGLSTKPRQLELRRSEAEMRGAIGQYGGQYTTAMQTIAQVESEVVSTTEARRSDISRERAETQAAQADAEQRLRAANDLLQKREIMAPEAGTVTDFKFFTPGSSIVAGQPVLDLVPDSQRLLVEGTVAPSEVEHLAIGQRVNVRLTAYKAHRVPVITGHLTYVGADRQLDANNLPVFMVRAELDADALRDKPGVVLMPGMPAEILIVNGARSVLDFLISPITDGIGRGDEGGVAPGLAMRVCALTNVYNERFNLPIWLRHYEGQVGPENLLILDHGSDDGSTGDIGRAGVVRLPRTPFDDPQRADLVSHFATGLLRLYDAVIYSDCDEMLVADPAEYRDLTDFAARMDGPAATAIGLNVRHNLVAEDSLQHLKGILAQRSLVQFVSPMCKTLLVKQPPSWGGGFHSSNFEPAFGGLYLFHLRDMDLAASLQRLAITRHVEFANPQHGQHHRATADAYVRRFLPVASAPIAEGWDFSADTRTFRDRVIHSHTNRWYIPEHWHGEMHRRIPERFRDVF